MVKGFRREVVVLREPNSPYIEEAYFVLRETAMRERPTDLVAEANRIIARSKLGVESPKTVSHPLGAVKWFSLGVVSMFALGMTIFLILL